MQKDQIIPKIEQFFKVPEQVADKIKNIAERVKGGYVLIENRPRWDGSAGHWTRLPVAKMIFHKPTKLWKLYWMRASGKWWFYGEYKTLNGVLKAIKKDKNSCFWG
ncbi:MAG: hypothetical protein COX43_03015 [Parcubacteria group bacterium CG23_combo_of_CG06-09_8_20_14_all_35_9]|nr:MAG: hypothetical protein COX43_03015 [Parcubacteria group bacterium CG23_combo_of_CG06-09_8_20_14_all_35_9]